jgi:hypothetical protein
VVGSVALCVSLTVVSVRPLKLGCCVKVGGACIDDVLRVRCVMQFIVGILVLGW